MCVSIHYDLRPWRDSLHSPTKFSSLTTNLFARATYPERSGTLITFGLNGVNESKKAEKKKRSLLHSFTHSSREWVFIIAAARAKPTQTNRKLLLPEKNCFDQRPKGKVVPFEWATFCGCGLALEFWVSMTPGSRSETIDNRSGLEWIIPVLN